MIRVAFITAVALLLSSIYAQNAILPKMDKTIQKARIGSLDSAFMAKSFANTRSNDYRMLNRFESANGMAVRYQQLYKNLPVIGSSIAVNIRKGSISQVNGFEFKVDSQLNTTASVSFEKSLEQVQKALPHLQQCQVKFQQLAILCSDSGSHLVWQSVVKKGNQVWKIIADAHEAETIHAAFSLIQTFYQETGNVSLISDGQQIGPNVDFGCTAEKSQYRLSSTVNDTAVRTYNMNKGESTNKGDEDSSSNPIWQDAVTATAHYYTEQVAVFYKELFNRNSLDDKFMDLISRVHVPDPQSGNKKFDNAYWDGEMMSYGDGSWDGTQGYFTPLCVADVVSHELSHGVTTNTSNLEYWYQSGAMNESFSDIMAAAFEYWLNEKINNSNMDWTKVGEECVPAGSGIKRDALRYMDDPTLAKQPKDFKGTHWLEWWEALNDNGGVHTNSGVGNRAYYLLAVGGQQNGVTVEGIGALLAAKVFYYSNAKYLNTSSEYRDWPAACRSAVDDLSDEDIQALGTQFAQQSRENIIDSINNAWKAVKVNGNDEETVAALRVATQSNYLAQGQSSSSRIKLTKDTSCTITVNFTGKDIDIYVYDNNGCKIISSNSSENNSQITFTAPYTGFYTIEAHSFAGSGEISIDVKTK